MRAARPLAALAVIPPSFLHHAGARVPPPGPKAYLKLRCCLACSLGGSGGSRWVFPNPYAFFLLPFFSQARCRLTNLTHLTHLPQT
jgi:hypothetical protein